MNAATKIMFNALATVISQVITNHRIHVGEPTEIRVGAHLHALVDEAYEGDAPARLWGIPVTHDHTLQPDRGAIWPPGGQITEFDFHIGTARQVARTRTAVHACDREHNVVHLSVELAEELIHTCNVVEHHLAAARAAHEKFSALAGALTDARPDDHRTACGCRVGLTDHPPTQDFPPH